MKITVVTASTKKPLVNTQVQLQVRGKDSGFLSMKTDASGQVVLDEKYKGQQVTSTLGGTQGPWVTVSEGATLVVGVGSTAGSATGAKEKEKQHTPSK